MHHEQPVLPDIPDDEEKIAPICSMCRGVGYYLLDVPIEHPQFATLIPCECKKLVWKQRDIAHHAQHMAQLREEFGELASSTLENFDCHRQINNDIVWYGYTFSVESQYRSLDYGYQCMQAYFDAPGGWYFFAGPSGSGKSHLAAAVANRLAEIGWSVGYASVPEILDFVRHGFGDHTAHERVETLQHVQFLVLDDMGAENATAWAEETLFRIVNHRYLHQRATFFTSNLPLCEVPERIASRIAGRTHGNEAELWLPVGDYRLLGKRVIGMG